MKWFSRLKVSGRLSIGFALMIVLMAVNGFEGSMSIRKIHGSLENIFSVRMPSLDYLLEADRDLQQALVAERSVIFANANSDIFKQMVND
jgi:methyl-accepting chemotaxis protein